MPRTFRMERKQPSHAEGNNDHGDVEGIPDEFPPEDIPDEFPTEDNPDEFPPEDIPDQFPTEDIPDEFPTEDNPDQFPPEDIPDEFPPEDIPDEIPPEDIPDQFPQGNPLHVSASGAVIVEGNKRRVLPAVFQRQQPPRTPPRTQPEDRDSGGEGDCKIDLTPPRPPGPLPRDLEVAPNQREVSLYSSSSSSSSAFSVYYIDEVDRVPEAESIAVSGKSRIRRMGRAILRGLRILARPFVSCCCCCSRRRC